MYKKNRRVVRFKCGLVFRGNKIRTYATGNTELLGNIVLIASFSTNVKQVPVDISIRAITEQHLLNRCLQKYP
jgi:hypothetical protein